MNPSMIWPTPHPEDQFSHIAPQDSFACVSYAATHSIESQILFMGQDTQYSERFLAKMSGTTLHGNSLVNVVNTIKKYGMVLDSDWPEPLTFTWAEYYADIPPEIVAKGQDFLKMYEVSDVKTIAPPGVNTALTEAPLIVFLPSGTPIHSEMVRTPEFCFNSYPPYETSYPNSIYGFYQFIIKPKGVNVPQIKTLNIKGEEGIFLAASTPEEYLVLCKIFGKPPTPPDESV